MDTACYYTLSTIAQTLAGAFGFLVAVVLFRLQALAVERREVAESLRRARDGLIPGTDKDTESSRLRLELTRHDQVYQRIREGLIWSLWGTFTSIGTCLGLLPLTPYLLSRPPWVLPLLLASIVLTALVTLLTYTFLVLAVVRGTSAGSTEAQEPPSASGDRTPASSPPG